MNRTVCCIALLVPLLGLSNCQSDEWPGGPGSLTSAANPMTQRADGDRANDAIKDASPNVGFDDSSYLFDLFDSLFGICQDNSPDGDLCHQTMRALYCLYRFPIIYHGFRYSQNQASALCRAEVQPFYPDIVECMAAQQFFVVCLANRRWPPEATDLFDVNNWHPVYDAEWIGRIQALNFFRYRGRLPPSGYTAEVWYDGAVTSISPPAMRVVQDVWGESPWDFYQSLCTGTSEIFSPRGIRIPCFGFYWYLYWPDPRYYQYFYTDVLLFAPRGAEGETD